MINEKLADGGFGNLSIDQSFKTSNWQQRLAIKLQQSKLFNFSIVNRKKNDRTKRQ